MTNKNQLMEFLISMWLYNFYLKTEKYDCGYARKGGQPGQGMRIFFWFNRNKLTYYILKQDEA